VRVSLRMPLHVRALILFVTHQTIMMLGTVGGLHVVLPTITEDFNTTITTTVWVMLAYSLALAGGTFALGKSSTLLEKRMLITFGLVVDVGLLVAIFYTHNIYFFIAARFFSAFVRIYPWLILQVMGIGGFPAEQRGKVLGIMGVVQGFGMMASVPVAGFVTDLWGWRWLFMGSAWAFALMIVPVWLMLPKLDPPADAPKVKLSQFDIPGSALMMVGVVALLAALQLFVRGYAPSVVTVLAVVTVVGLAAFVWVEMHTKTPIVPFALFKVRGVMMGALQAVTMGWMQGSLQLLLSFLFIVGFGWSVAYAASILFFMGLVRPLSRFVAGWASDRYGSSVVVVSAGVAAVVGQLIISFVGVSPNLGFIIGALILMGLGQAAMQTANQRQIFTSIPREQLHLAPSVSLVLSTSGSSVGLAFVAAALVSGASLTSGSGIADNQMVETASNAIRVVTAGLVVGLTAAQMLPRIFGRAPVETEESQEKAAPAR
jgi:MFS family permease